MLYNFLFLLSILVLQRIDFLFTSAGFFLLVLLSYYTFVKKFNSKERFSIKGKNFIYIMFLFAFLFNIPIYISDIAPEKLTIMITPLLVWILLSFSNDIKYKYIFNDKILYIVLFVIGGILIRDFYTMFTTNSVIKKVFDYANPNYTAYIILILEVLYIFHRKIYNKNNILFFAIATFLILFTLSKTSYVVQVLIWLMILDRKSLIRLSIIFTSIVFFIGIAYSDNVIDIFDKMSIFFNRDLSVALEHRGHLIMAAFSIYSDNLLFGCGYEQFQNLAYSKYGSGLNVKTHNILLTIMAENGTIGLILFLTSSSLLWFFAIKDKVFRKEKSLLLLIFYMYALTHAGSQYFAFIPLFFFIVLENNKCLYGGYKC